MTSSPASARPTWRRRVFNRYSLAAGVLLLASGGYFGWQHFAKAKNAREQYNLSTVQRGDIQDLVTATGTVQPRDYVDVGAQVSGQLKKLHVEVGSQVKAGELLAEIDPTVLTANVEARRAGLRTLQATLKDRESQLTLAQLQFTRQKNLMAEDATTTEQVQQAEAALRSVRAQIESAKAQIDQTQSTLRADEANLNYARIYAPMGGTVVSLPARQGQTLNANQAAPTLMRIADLSTMTVQTQVSEADVSKLRQGMEVYFTTLGSQGRRWYGSLRKVEPTPTVTNNVVLYNALFDVPNANQSLMPSMTAQVFFIAAAAQDVLLVPAAAIQRQPLGAGGRRGREGAAAGEGRAASAPAVGASQASQVAQAAPAASKAERRERAPRAEAVTSTPAATPPAERLDDERRANRERFAGMSPEERRAYFESLTPEQRQAMRERRRAEGGGERGEQREGGERRRPSEAAPTASAEAASGNAGSGERRRARPAAAAPNASGPSARGPVTSGFAGSSNTPRAPRRGTVKVIAADGKIEERQVELGINNRVQVQVLSGLKEGEQVIAGVKPPPQQQRSGQGGGQQGGGMPQGLGAGGMGGAGGGMGGGGRGR